MFMEISLVVPRVILIFHFRLSIKFLFTLANKIALDVTLRTTLFACVT